MSKFKLQKPVIHIPTIKKWLISREAMTEKVVELGFVPLYPDGVHQQYCYTDVEGLAKMLPDLLLASSLYKKDVFTCINYAYKVWNECSGRYGINTWVPIIGRIPNYTVRHAWQLIMLGNEQGIDLDKSLFFEPNDGWQMGVDLEMAYQAFPIGEEGYLGEFIFY